MNQRRCQVGDSIDLVCFCILSMTKSRHVIYFLQGPHSIFFRATLARPRAGGLLCGNRRACAAWRGRAREGSVYKCKVCKLFVNGLCGDLTND